MKKSPIPLCVVLLGGLLAGCSASLLQSHWDDTGWPVTGKSQRMNDKVILDDHRVSVSLSNNESTLRIVVVTGDPGLKRLLMRQGMTVWFDAQGGKNRAFGLHYPVGGADRRLPGVRPDREAGEKSTGSLGFSSDELEICGPGPDERHRMTLAETGGIGAEMQAVDDSLTIELTVPLSDGDVHPFGIGAKPGTVIGVGFAAGQSSGMVTGSGSGPRDGGGRRSGDFGERGFPRRGIASEGSPVRGNRPTPLDVWVKVQLAASQASALNGH